MRRATIGPLVVALVTAAWLTPAHAQSAGLAGYDLQSTEWNGLSSLAMLAAHGGVALEQRDELSLDESVDVLVLMYPTASADWPAVARWVGQGGRLLVADDFGAAGALEREFGLERVAPGPAASVIEANEHLPVTGSVGVHALSFGAPELVLNHPSGLRGTGLPVYAFEDGTGVVYDMSLGSGVAVFVSDPSLFTNLMLPLRGNARFASNLLARLCPRREGCEAVLVSGGARVEVSLAPAESRGAPRWPERLQEVVSRLQRGRIRPEALHAAAVLLLVGTLVLLLSVFPRRAPAWIRRRFEPRAPRPLSAFEFSLRRFTRSPREPSMALPAALLRERFEALFYPALGVASPTPATDAAWFERVADGYIRRFEPDAGPARRRRLVRLLRALAEVPPRHQLNMARLPWVEPRQLIRWTALVRSVLEHMELDERFREQTRRPGAHR